MSQFQVGGSLSGDAPSYVKRQADVRLYQALMRQEFCYVLDSRQMGKSSLLVQVRSRLKQANGRCTTLDLTSLGSNVTAEQWYQGIGAELCLGFDLLDMPSFLAWWRQQGGLPPVQKLSQLIDQVLLTKYPQTPLYVFIDEVDSVLSLPFSADDLFALIRACYNRRSLDPRFRQLTFAIAGVATPSDLIADKSRTPFNIGYGIELAGFQLSDVAPLIAGLQPVSRDATALMQAILRWTNGQPLLTQKLCQLVVDFFRSYTEPLPVGVEADWIDGLVQDRILHNWEAQDEPEHLRSIRDRILRSEQRAGRLLGLYQKMLDSQFVSTSDSPDQVELLLSGLVIRTDGYLQTKNRIYETVFDPAWVAQKLSQLRPYGDNLTAWLASGQTDESRLLRGQALQDAQGWAAGKSLDDQDYRYLVASEALDRQVVQQQLEAARAREAEARLQQERRATRLQRILLGVVSFALLLTAGLSAATFWQYRQALKQEQQAEQETLRTLATSAKALLASDQQLDALVAAVRARYRLTQLAQNGASDPALEVLQAQVTTVLRQTLLNTVEVNRLSSHVDVVNDVAFSPDGSMLATVSPDHRLKLWRTDGTLVRTVDASADDIYAVDFSGDGQRVAIATGGSAVELWTVAGERVRSLEGHGATVWFVTYGPKGELIASASQDGTARLWSADGELLQVFQGHEGPVYGADISPDQQLFATASTDGTAKIWRRDGTVQTTLTGHDGPVWAVAFSPTQDLVVTTGQDQTVRLWQTDGTPIRTLTGHSGGIWGATFSPDGTFLVSTSIDGTAKIWSEQGLLLETLTGHEDTVWGVDISPDGQTIATASWDQTARLWLRSHPLKQTIYAPSDSVTDIAYNATGTQFASASLDGAVQLWGRTGELVRTVGRHDVEAWAVAISPDGTYLLSGSADNTAKIWSLDGTLLHTLTGHKDAVYGVDISADSKTIVTSSIDGTVKFWSPDGVLKRTLDTGQASLFGTKFSPDGQTLATVGAEKSLRLWTPAGQLLHSIEDDAINAVTFSPDGQMLATISDTSVDLRQADGTLLRRLPLAPEETSSLTDIDFSANSQLIAATQWNSRLKTWQIKLWRIDGTEVTTLFGAQNNIDAIAFSPDGTTLASGSFGKTITLWNLDQLLDLNEVGLACDWIGGYLRNSPEVDEEGRSLCE